MEFYIFLLLFLDLHLSVFSRYYKLKIDQIHEFSQLLEKFLYLNLIFLIYNIFFQYYQLHTQNLLILFDKNKRFLDLLQE